MSLGKSHLIIVSKFNPLNYGDPFDGHLFLPQSTDHHHEKVNLAIADTSLWTLYGNRPFLCGGKKTFSWLHVVVLSATVHLIRRFVDVNFRLFWHQTSSADNTWSWLSYVIYRWVIFEPFVGLVRGMTALWRLDMFNSTISNVKVMFYFFTLCSSTGSGIFGRLRARRGRGIVKKKPLLICSHNAAQALQTNMANRESTLASSCT